MLLIILFKSEDLRSKMEDRLDAKIPIESELYSKLDMTKEIFKLKYIKY